MSHFEKAQELFSPLQAKLSAIGSELLDRGQDMKEQVLGGVALLATVSTLAALGVNNRAEASEVPVGGGLPNVEDCENEATHPSYLTTPGADYRKDSLTKLDVDSIDVPAMRPGCATLGDRKVAVYAQTQGKKGKWGRYSDIALINDDSENTYSFTLTTRRFTPIPGPANRKIRLVSRYSFTPEGSSKPSAAKSYFGKPLRYGPLGDGR